MVKLNQLILFPQYDSEAIKKPFREKINFLKMKFSLDLVFGSW